MERIFNRLLNQIKDKKDMEDTLAYLRAFDFRFVDTELFYDHFPKASIREDHQHYQFMVRWVKRGQYDLRLFLAIKMWGRRTPKIYIYYQGQLQERIKKPWKKKADINFRKIIKRWKFPDGLTYEERRKWRAEHRKVMNPRKPYAGTDWYHHWREQIVYTETPQ